jgi:hypothetical protein
MHNNELPSKESELKLNKGAATSELHYLLQRKGRGLREEEEETFYKSFGVGSKMQILCVRYGTERNGIKKRRRPAEGGCISHVASLFGCVFRFASKKCDHRRVKMQYLEF